MFPATCLLWVFFFFTTLPIKGDAWYSSVDWMICLTSSSIPAMMGSESFFCCSCFSRALALAAACTRTRGGGGVNGARPARDAARAHGQKRNQEGD